MGAVVVLRHRDDHLFIVNPLRPNRFVKHGHMALEGVVDLVFYFTARSTLLMRLGLGKWEIVVQHFNGFFLSEPLFTI